MAAGLSASLLSPPRRRVLFLWGSSGSARLPIIAPQSWLQRPQTLMNNPTHRLLKKKFSQEQRRQQKRSRRGLGRYLGALRACGLSNRAGCPQRAGRWRAHMPQQHLHCKNLLQNGGSVSVACARGPLLREDACAILRVSVTRIAVCRLLVSALRAARPNRTTARRGRWACAWRGRNGSQVRLSGTALRYCSAQHPRP